MKTSPNFVPVATFILFPVVFVFAYVVIVGIAGLNQTDYFHLIQIFFKICVFASVLLVPLFVSLRMRVRIRPIKRIWLLPIAFVSYCVWVAVVIAGASILSLG